MKNRIFTLPCLLVAGAILSSCQENDPNPTNPQGGFSNGVLVINGGNFSENNGSISFIPTDSVGARMDIFRKANSISPEVNDGRIQAYAQAGDYGLVLFDNSNNGQDAVEIVNSGNFVVGSTLKTPDVENPRHAVEVAPNKAYVSNWNVLLSEAPYYSTEGFITVIDLTSGATTKTINVGMAPQKMVAHEGRVFIGRDAFATQNTLLVVDALADEIKDSLHFSFPPTPLGIDANGKLWVAAGIQLHIVDPGTLQISQSITLGNDPSKALGSYTFDPTGNKLYFTLTSDYGASGKLYSLNIDVNVFDESDDIANRNFSGLGIDPSGQIIYAGVTPSLRQAGYALRMETDGSTIDSVAVEVSPEGFYFN